MTEDGAEAAGRARAQLVKMTEVADILGISVRAVYRLVASGELPPPVKIGKASRMVLAELDMYVERLKDQRNKSQGVWSGARGPDR